MSVAQFTEILLLALGVTVSPIPMAAVILVMMSNRGVSNGVGFVVGWIGAMLFLAGGGGMLLQEIGQPGQGEPGTGMSVFRVGFGVFLLSISARCWLRRNPKGVTRPVPGWMRMLDEFGALRSFLLGVLLLIGNVKNLPLTLEAASALSRIENEVFFAMMLMVFTVVSSVGIFGPVIAAWLGGERADRQLKRLRQWLQDHNAIILFVIFLLLGSRALVRGLAGLM